MSTDSEALKNDIEELRATLNVLAKDVSSISRSMAKGLKASTNSTGDILRDGTRTVAGEIGEMGKESAAAIEKSVHDRPLQSLLVAFGAGLVLAQVLRKS